MTSKQGLLKSVEAADGGLSLAQLLAFHTDLARRTAQRWLSRFVEEGRVIASGQGRSRRYFPSRVKVPNASATEQESFPSFIPLSADSRDIVAYINQPLEARKPVGYQRDFLASYQPNITSYLPASLRRQLHKLGSTAEIGAPAELIKQTIRAVVSQPDKDTLTLIQQTVKTHVPDAERANVQALIIEELRRLHDGVLARYGLRPSELAAWKAAQ